MKTKRRAMPANACISCLAEPGDTPASSKRTSSTVLSVIYADTRQQFTQHFGPTYTWAEGCADRARYMDNPANWRLYL